MIQGNGAVWTDGAGDLATPQAMFCIMGGDNRNPTDEPIGAEMILAAEGLESEERGYSDQRRLKAATRRIYFPAIATRAQLSVCSSAPNSISLVDGTLPSGAEFTPAAAVRFHKQISTEPAPGPFGPHGQEAATLSRAKERAVYYQRRKFQRLCVRVSGRRSIRLIRLVAALTRTTTKFPERFSPTRGLGRHQTVASGIRLNL